MGRNDLGRCGIVAGSYLSTATEVTQAPAAGVNAIAMGATHSLFLDGNGAVWSAGANDHGELGSGNTEPCAVPALVSGLSGVVAVGAGWEFSLAAQGGGTVWAWGKNDYGQFGNGSTDDSTTPVQVSGLSNVIALGGGRDFAVALKSDGTVWAWGRNDRGQLGNGTTTNSTTPDQVSGLSNITAISVAQYGNVVDRGARAFIGKYALALKEDGTVWAWGSNFSGHLGDCTMVARSTPVQVEGLSNITAISAGADHNVAIDGNGRLYSWGANNFGKLGDGDTFTKRFVPAPVTW